MALLAVAYLPFLLRLPRPTRNLFLLAAVLFVSGAIGFEMLGAWRYSVLKHKDWLYVLLRVCEETLEKTGVAVFAFALLRHLAGGGGRTLGVRLGVRGRALGREDGEPTTDYQQPAQNHPVLRGASAENPAAELISAG